MKNPTISIAEKWIEPSLNRLEQESVLELSALIQSELNLPQVIEALRLAEYAFECASLNKPWINPHAEVSNALKTLRGEVTIKPYARNKT